MNLVTRLGSLVLRNPVILASGTAGYGQEIARFIDLAQVGALTVKGLSVFPHQGNPPPRIHETCAGVLNSIGLENKGFDRFVTEDLSFLEQIPVCVIVNIWGRTEDEYFQIARKVNRLSGIDAIEVNVSCPNVERGGMSFSAECAPLLSLVGKIRRIVDKPMIVKLGPVTPGIGKTARLLQEAGVDILSLTNTFPALAVDLSEQKPVFVRRVAGLSGPAIKPLALWMLDQVRNCSDLPVIGMGGIMRGADALEFLLLGAQAVGVGTATLIDPLSALRIIEDIRDYLVQNNLNQLSDIIGKAR